MSNLKEYWKQYIGKRVLMKERNSYSIKPYYDEAIVKEVSPSGERVCFDFSPQGGCRRVWRDADEYEVVEVLGVGTLGIEMQEG